MDDIIIGKDDAVIEIISCIGCRHKGLSCCMHPYARCPQYPTHPPIKSECHPPCYECIKRMRYCPYDVEKRKELKNAEQQGNSPMTTNPILLQGEREGR